MKTEKILLYGAIGGLVLLFLYKFKRRNTDGSASGGGSGGGAVKTLKGIKTMDTGASSPLTPELPDINNPSGGTGFGDFMLDSAVVNDVPSSCGEQFMFRVEDGTKEFYWNNGNPYVLDRKFNGQTYRTSISRMVYQKNCMLNDSLAMPIKVALDNYSNDIMIAQV